MVRNGRKPRDGEAFIYRQFLTRKRTMVPRKAIWILGLGAVAALIVRELLGGSWWVDDLMPNLATEVFGILVTVLIIDRALELRRLARNRELAVIASRKLLRSVTHIGSCFAEMIHASLWPTDEQRPSSLISVLTGQNAGYLVRLDLSRSAHVVPEVAWVDWAADVLASEKERLGQLVRSYLAYLPTQVVAAMEAIEDDTVVSFLPRFREMYPRFAKESKEPFVLGDSWRGYVDELFTKLVDAIECTARIADEQLPQLPDGWWEGMGRPEIGRHRGSPKDAMQIGINPARP